MEPIVTFTIETAAGIGKEPVPDNVGTRHVFLSLESASQTDRTKTHRSFVDEVNSHFPEFDYSDDGFAVREEITRAVFETLSNHVSAGEIDDVIACLQKGLRQLRG